MVLRPPSSQRFLAYVVPIIAAPAASKHKLWCGFRGGVSSGGGGCGGREPNAAGGGGVDFHPPWSRIPVTLQC